MTVIRPNSIAGITSITAQGENISFYSSNGVSISQFNVNVNSTSGVSTIANANVTGVTTITNGPILIGSGTSTGTSTQRLQVTGSAYVSGNLGLGATNPSAVLDVSGNSKTTTLQIGTNPAGVSIGCLGIPNQKRIYGRNAANSGDVNIAYIDGSNGMVFGPSDAAVIDSSGKFGIGTNSPLGKLAVVYTLAAGGDSDGVRLTDSTNNTVSFFGTTGSSYSYAGLTGHNTTLYGARDVGIVADNANNGQIKFCTGGSERSRIDTSGRLLIGTSTASGNALLQVNGGIRQSLFSDKPDTAGIPSVGETRIYQFNLAAANTWENVFTPAADGNAFYTIHFRIGVSDRTNSFGFAQLYYSTGAVLILISGSASNIRVNSNILQLNGTGFGTYGLTTFMHITRIG
jgi:hypothetical protein